MGKALYDERSEAREIFEQADEILGRKLSTLCFEGPEEDLKLTMNTQPALYVSSAAALAVLEAEGIKPSITAGHSLGEYTALYAAGTLDFETGLQLVEQRGKAMYEAGLARPGTMAALLNLDGETVTDICKKASAKGIVVPANWNSAAQIVVSGEPEAVAEAVRLAQEAGSKRSVMLPVSGAFHSPLVEPARVVMAAVLKKAVMQAPHCRFVANVSAEVVSEADTIRQGLIDQVISCVRWADSVQTMVNSGADQFIEVGSGKVLTGLLRRIDKSLKGVVFGAPADLENVKAALAAE